MKAKYNFNISKLTFILFELNHLIDEGVHVNCSYDVMKYHMNNGTVFNYLNDTFSKHCSFCYATMNDKSNFVKYFNISMKTFIDVIDTNRKMCIKNNGITLLIAFITELIQEGEWKPNFDIAGLDD